MKRIMNLSEETDGNFYKSSDSVPLACDGCLSCGESAVCCRQTEDTIILDPYDFYMLEKATGMTFESGYKKYFDLRVADGIVLPYLMKDQDGACVFLDAAGRCSVHSSRPGFCRLFPLGRLYRKGGFDYILQTGQCPCKAKETVTVADWLGIDDLEQYEKFVLSWHRITEMQQKKAAKLLTSGDIDNKRTAAGDISLVLLNTFYLRSYDIFSGFYKQYNDRLKSVKTS